MSRKTTVLVYTHKYNSFFLFKATPRGVQEGMVARRYLLMLGPRFPLHFSYNGVCWGNSSKDIAMLVLVSLYTSAALGGQEGWWQGNSYAGA